MFGKPFPTTKPTPSPPIRAPPKPPGPTLPTNP